MKTCIEKKLTKKACHSERSEESLFAPEKTLRFAQGDSHIISKQNDRFGFTLIELLVALMASSIIFASIATLAFAVGSAQKSSEDMDRFQAQLRYATLRITELIRHAKLAVQVGDDLVIWKSDDNVNDAIDPAELVYIEAGTGRSHIYILEFPDAAGDTVSLESIKNGTAKTSLISLYEGREIEIIPQCSNVKFYEIVIQASGSVEANEDGIDENSDFIGIGFDWNRAGLTRHYEISAALRCRNY